MEVFFTNPTVNSMIVLVILAGGGYLVKLFTNMSSKLTEVNDAAKVTHEKIENVTTIATKTETLVNSQRAEMKAEILELRTKLDASTVAAVVAARTASELAIQATKDLAIHTATQLALELATRPAPAIAPATSGPSEPVPDVVEMRPHIVPAG